MMQMKQQQDLAQLIEEFKQRCQQKGLKLTYQRMVIYEALATSHDHPDAEHVYKRVRERIPTISRDTVYRTLALLCDMGLIASVGCARDRVRFDTNVGIHHHFICQRCGTAYDVDWPEFQRLDVPDDLRRVGRLESIRVELRGTCKNCAPEPDDRRQTQHADAE
jgi:Fur family peroxide stress response transcriptional regulator